MRDAFIVLEGKDMIVVVVVSMRGCVYYFGSEGHDRTATDETER